MAFSPLVDNGVTVLQPTGVSSGTALNLSFVACDPINGNYFTASGRDLLTFTCTPVAAAPAWSSSVSYTQGQVVNVSSVAYIAIANASPNLNQNPTTATSFWSLYNESTLTIYSAPDQCTGRKADIVNYVVPDGGYCEFLVLPSAVFTQSNGQVQFLVSSNLVEVLIRAV